jgi:8-oxo-dGTP pyrophosphatase MutT (NUDIX family)
MAKNHVVAKVLLVNPENQVLILRRSESAPRRPLEFDIPGGWVDEGEDFLTAAVRETDEEVGISVKPEELELVYTHTKHLDVGNTSWLFFVAKINQTEVKISHEHDQSEWVTLDQAIEKIPYKVQNDFLAYVRDNNLI